MSADTVIRVERLSKRYLIGHERAGHGSETFREMIMANLRRLGRGARDMAQGRQMVTGDDFEAFDALRDVSFDVSRGEVLGVIGRNGAGKSTLLKILSRITEPSSGRVTIRGRVASLLEVGTGFHAELTGRENIFLNGAILGMSRAEIRRKFDEIVAFADVERFLDTPVKRYSSGMYVRLAFAVAAHLEPEILIIDEVLAVGDAEFQRKCLGKMHDVAGSGRTVLFVSHNMGAVESLCTRCILLADGKAVASGQTSEVVQDYLIHLHAANHARAATVDRRIDNILSITDVRLSANLIRSGDSCEIEVVLLANKPGLITDFHLTILSASGLRLGIYDLRDDKIVPLRHDAGEFAFKVKIDRIPLVEGHYMLGFGICCSEVWHTGDDLRQFQVIPGSNASPVRYPANDRGFLEFSGSSIRLH